MTKRPALPDACWRRPPKTSSSRVCRSVARLSPSFRRAPACPAVRSRRYCRDVLRLGRGEFDDAALLVMAILTIALGIFPGLISNVL